MKRKITLEKLDEDGYASLYVIKIDDDKKYEYTKFWEKFESSKKLKWEFDLIDTRIETILMHGAEDEHFRLEGKGTKALPIELGSLLRLYCHRINKQILILGNGGYKPKNPDPTKNKTQDFPELEYYWEVVRRVGLEIEEQIKKKIISVKGNQLIGLKTFIIELPDEPKSEKK